MSQGLLTTLDNPYNPHTHFLEWFMFDQEKGYNTSGYISSLMMLPDDPTPEEYDAEYESVCEEILDLNVLGIYTMAYDPETEEGQERSSCRERAEEYESFVENRNKQSD